MILRTLLATVGLYAMSGGLAGAGGVGPYFAGWVGPYFAGGVGPYYHHRTPLGAGLYNPWLGCDALYGCYDSHRLRLELDRDRRLQELRERAAPGSRTYEAGEGPWGQQRYIPPATPESSIQPAYRGTGQLRPEYEQAARPAAKSALEPPR